MSLILHCGAEPVEYDALCQVETPPATATHVPLAHHRLVDLMVHTLTFFKHEVVEQHYGLTSDGMRFFALLKLRSEYGDYVDSIGMRNSHDRTMPIGVAFGSVTTVCDNMAFYSDHVIKRKHTKQAALMLPGLLAQIVEPLQEQRQAQALTFDRYKATMLTDQTADAAIMQLYRQNVINITRVADVVKQWDEPDFDWGDRTAFRLFNATTYALNGRVAAEPHITRNLHQVIDGVCSEVH